MSTLLHASAISKRFPGVLALDGVDLQVQAGEILAVVGENGAGKSTLMKILGGVYRPDAGTIRLRDHAVTFRSVKEAEQAGIVLIHQELNLAEDLDVAGNVFLGREPTTGGFLKIIHRSIYQETEAITRRLGLDVSVRTQVGRLTVGQQQLVEIARALSLRSTILILDEPTSSLTEREAARLFTVLRELRNNGIAIVYISHRLKEVDDIADRVAVLRDGKNAGELGRREINHDAIVRLMVGRELKQFFRRDDRTESEHTLNEAILETRNVRWSTAQRAGVTLRLRAGEIVGMAGLMGAGRTELAETLFGIRPRLSGDVLLKGAVRNIRSPAQAIAAGIFLIPEDRRHQGLVLLESIRNNISLPNMDLVQRGGLVVPARERRLAERMCGELHVRTPSIAQEVGKLSGGNQQKVVLAKWLCRTPRVLILDEPTRGIDVGAKAEIYALMDQLARSGVAILMISSDLEEVLGMSNRVLVMHQGRLAGELPRERLSEEAIMQLATGGTE